MSFTNTELNGEEQAKYFQWFIVLMCCYAFVYLATMMTAGKARFKYFTKDFMAQFNQEHQEAFGADAPAGGHPDDGNGYYAQKLSYADWYNYNNTVRSHMNFLETAIPVAVMVLITSIFQPLWALICAAGLVTGRILYAIGYRVKGPKGRVCGAIIVDLALIGAFIGAIVSLS